MPEKFNLTIREAPVLFYVPADPAKAAANAIAATTASMAELLEARREIRVRRAANQTGMSVEYVRRAFDLYDATPVVIKPEPVATVERPTPEPAKLAVVAGRAQARKGTCQDAMEKMLHRVPEARLWSLSQWHERIGFAESTIQGTAAWKSLELSRNNAAAYRREKSIERQQRRL